MIRPARLLATIFVSGCFVAGCAVELEHGLDERQANEMLSLLVDDGIAAEKLVDDSTAGAYRIAVPRDSIARAFALFKAHDLPRSADKGLADAFASGGLLPSAVEERARLSAALAADLERTLESLPGVSTARVHVALAQTNELEESPPARTTASVLLKTVSTLAVTDLDLRHLVAGAIPSLKPTDVNVVVAMTPLASVAAPATQPERTLTGKAHRITIGLLSLIAVVALLGILLTALAIRSGRLRRELAALQASAALAAP